LFFWFLVACGSLALCYLFALRQGLATLEDADGIASVAMTTVGMGRDYRQLLKLMKEERARAAKDAEIEEARRNAEKEYMNQKMKIETVGQVGDDRNLWYKRLTKERQTAAASRSKGGASAEVVQKIAGARKANSRQVGPMGGGIELV